MTMAFIRRLAPLMPGIKNITNTNQVNKIHRWVAPTLRDFKKRESKQGGKITNPRNTFLEWNSEAELYAFGKRLNEDFDSDLLLQAFTDRSYVIKEEMKQKEMNIDLKLKDNRELAEQGEKFISEYVQQYLEVALPKLPLEGIVSIKKYLISEITLAHVSTHLGTKDIILADEYPVDESILAKTFKAVVGALLQSSGEEQTAHFVRDFLITQLQGKDVNEFWQIEDPWTMLISLIGKTGSEMEPRLIGEAGKNTLLACYRVGIYLDKKLLSTGFGESIAIAKEMAAREALKKIFGTEDDMYPINFKIQGIPKKNIESRHKVSLS